MQPSSVGSQLEIVKRNGRGDIISSVSKHCHAVLQPHFLRPVLFNYQRFKFRFESSQSNSASAGWEMSTDALQLGSEGRYCSFHLRMHTLALKTVIRR